MHLKSGKYSCIYELKTPKYALKTPKYALKNSKTSSTSSKLLYIKAYFNKS